MFDIKRTRTFANGWKTKDTFENVYLDYFIKGLLIFIIRLETHFYTNDHYPHPYVVFATHFSLTRIYCVLPNDKKNPAYLIFFKRSQVSDCTFHEMMTSNVHIETHTIDRSESQQGQVLWLDFDIDIFLRIG